MSGQGGTAERRGHPRLDAAADVEIVIDSAPGAQDLGGRALMCRTGDVSLRGVRLLTDAALPVGTYLKISIRLPRHPERFRQSGKVVWCRPNAGAASGAAFQAGIEFSLAGNPDLDAWRGALLRLFEEGVG